MEWGTSVLFTHSRDGILFKIDQSRAPTVERVPEAPRPTVVSPRVVPAPAERRPVPNDLHQRAVRATAESAWDKAIPLWDELLTARKHYRSSGDVLLSPVWHRWRDGGFDVVTGGDDVKARHLRADPRASIVLFESEPPYRGIEVRGQAVLGHADADVVRDIAVRYLGDEKGRAYADGGHDDTLVRLEPGRLRAWDFADDL